MFSWICCVKDDDLPFYFVENASIVERLANYIVFFIIFNQI